MLIKIGITLAFVALSAPALAQSLGGFQQFESRDNKGRNNIPQAYRTQPNDGYVSAPVKPAANAYTDPFGANVSAPTFGGTYSNTYSGTYGNTYGNSPVTRR
jgi:hypothetical protein